ncbi:hypothetical protein NQ318_008974 [Aromia moschata]|uniref:Uncharacterized protein n=1 Tax=Aromia moschata TaxID=1265417 RepID=A0AAV8ZB15_9CUCU|nr:hypothetical protein NQ318_008974 [Aromia moschata]
MLEMRLTITHFQMSDKLMVVLLFFKRKQGSRIYEKPPAREVEPSGKSRDPSTRALPAYVIDVQSAGSSKQAGADWPSVRNNISNFFAFDVLPLAISTPLHTTFPLLKAVLEVRFCQLIQNFCFNRFHTFESSKMFILDSFCSGVRSFGTTFAQTLRMLNDSCKIWRQALGSLDDDLRGLFYNFFFNVFVRFLALRAVRGADRLRSFHVPL